MTPVQCKAARALLNLSQPQLAMKAGVGLSTIVDFERSRRKVADESVAIIAKALQDAGIVFIEENGGGPGVRLKKSRS